MDDKGTESVALATKKPRPWEEDARSHFPRTLYSDTMPLLNAFWAIAEEFDDDDEG